MRSAAAGLRQSNSRCRTGTQRSPCEVECSTACVKRRGKNIRQPEAFLDLGRSDVFHGTEPTPMAVRRSNRWKIKGDRHDTAGMQCNGMKRYCGCNSPAERRKWTCEDEERNSAKKQRLVFKWLFFFSAVMCLRNGGKPEEDRCYRDPETSSGEPDWSCRTEQRERPKRDRLIARDTKRDYCS